MAFISGKFGKSLSTFHQEFTRHHTKGDLFGTKILFDTKMSESANCEEQREEQTELEEAGGPEVGWFLKRALSLLVAVQLHLSQRAATQASINDVF